MRADQLLVERGLASSRSQAQRLIAAGVQWRAGEQWKAVAKNGDEVPLDAEVELLDAAEARYVSRGGLKLEAALRQSGFDVRGKACLDIGQSTGGFTDCLLQQGALKVVGVDVGQAQLHQKMREDARVICIEGVNARSLSATDLIAENDQGTLAPACFPLITGDLSFISLTLVLPALVPFLEAHGDLLMLVKPQFELQPENIGKHGLVKDPADYAVVQKRLRDACAALGLKVVGWHESAITGGDGSREFFIHAKKP